MGPIPANGCATPHRRECMSSAPGTRNLGLVVVRRTVSRSELSTDGCGGFASP